MWLLYAAINISKGESRVYGTAVVYTRESTQMTIQWNDFKGREELFIHNHNLSELIIIKLQNSMTIRTRDIYYKNNLKVFSFTFTHNLH